MGDEIEPKATERCRIESRCTRIQRHSTGRRLRLAAIAAIVTAWPASTWLASIYGEPGGFARFLAFVLGVLPIVLLVASLIIGQVESSRAGVASVTGSKLRLDRGAAGIVEVPLASIDSAFLRDFDDGAEVYFILRNRDVVRVDVRNAADANALVVATGQDPSRRRATVTLSHTWLSVLYWLVGAPAMVIGSAVLAAWMRSEFGGQGDFQPAILAGAALGLAVAALGGLMLGGEVSVGTDGVTIRRAFTRRFIPFDELDRVEYAGDVLVFVMRAGPRYRFFATANREPSPAALVERIQQAWRCARNGLKADGNSVLAREGRAVGEWKKALGEAITGKDGYRAMALSLDDLRRILGDASAPAEHRIAAALALSESSDAHDRERLRVAVDATASPRVRVAIAHAAEGRLEEDELNAAVDEARGAIESPARRV